MYVEIDTFIKNSYSKVSIREIIISYYTKSTASSLKRIPQAHFEMSILVYKWSNHTLATSTVLLTILKLREAYVAPQRLSQHKPRQKLRLTHVRQALIGHAVCKFKPGVGSSKNSRSSGFATSSTTIV
jgi:hypothetical protein